MPDAGRETGREGGREMCRGAGRDLGELRRVVVKVGSGIIAPAGRLDPLVIERIAKDVSAVRDTGLEVVFVVSGAVAAGYLGMGRDQPPTTVVGRQAAAAVGQYKLMTMFASEFEKCDTVVAQLLMMQDDIEDRRRFLSARHTLQELISRGILPIINENDPLADDEAKIGDNDHLAALVTSLTTADLLVILSIVPGVFRFGDEGEEVISTIEVGSEIDRHITDDQSETGVGGMRAKVRAARLASDWGVPTIIASGKEPGLLTRAVNGEEVGSLFVPGAKRLTERKRWIAIRTRSRGSIVVGRRRQACARRAGGQPSPYRYRRRRRGLRDRSAGRSARWAGGGLRRRARVVPWGGDSAHEGTEECGFQEGARLQVRGGDRTPRGSGLARPNGRQRRGLRQRGG